MRTSNITDCIEWNAKRYEQVFDYSLAAQLLCEELEELFCAPSVVEMLDAIGDISFVAIGVMWKLGIDQEDIADWWYGVDLTSLNILELNAHCNTVKGEFACIYNDTLYDPYRFAAFDLATNAVFLTALGTLRGLGMQSSFYDVVDAICESNATKVVKDKVASNIKANVDKGTTYKPPTEKLKQIEYLYTVKQGATA